MLRRADGRILPFGSGTALIGGQRIIEGGAVRERVERWP
jgi:hypothetical protein